MKQSRKDELLEKGWLDEEVKHAEEVLEKEEKHDAHFSKIVFWSAIIVIIFGNLIISFALVPYMIVLFDWLVYIVIIMLAGAVGFLYNLLITDIGHLERKHHLLAGIIVPVLALSNFLITVFISNDIIQNLEVKNPLHNAWLIGLVFGLAFITPYLGNRLRIYLKEKRSVPQ
ncbi:MAG: hypothetical protein ACTSYA_07065 [Candidatus Kariarchaeaceae archaeon]